MKCFFHLSFGTRFINKSNTLNNIWRLSCFCAYTRVTKCSTKLKVMLMRNCYVHFAVTYLNNLMSFEKNRWEIHHFTFFLFANILVAARICTNVDILCTSIQVNCTKRSIPNIKVNVTLIGSILCPVSLVVAHGNWIDKLLPVF